jgi:Putative Ig domain/Abnormal spindle-like microcephaly-assoc'd, ASPM-SPD-2-Hydin
MRLPLSIIQSLLVRTNQLLTIGTAILLLGMVSVGASAANSQLACTPPNLRFGAIAVGQTETLLVTVTNTGRTSATVSGIAVGNSEFTTSSLSLPLLLAAGQSVNLTVSFAPTTTGWTGGTIKFLSNASSANLNVGGTGTSSLAVSASPSIVSFGQVAIGATSSVPVVLTNARSWQVTLWSLQTMGSGFSISGPSFPVTLGVGQSVRLNVVFAPQSAGATGGSLFVSGPALAIPLTGTGIASAHSPAGQITSNPASLAFGSAKVGSSVTLANSITNTGGSSVTISQATATGAGFSISGLSVPVVLNPGASVNFSAVYAPQSAGSASGGITVASNASNSTLTVPLSGTGTAPAPAPVITSATTASGTVGTAFSYQITATNTPTSYGATGLPAGLSVNSTSGLISGTPTAAGTSTLTLSATNSGATGSANLTLTIASAPIPAPVITSATTASGTVGSAFSYQIAASNTPTSYGATGLPAGLLVSGTTGLISGTPTTVGTSTVTLSATNSGGTGNATLTLSIKPAVPVITSMTTASGTVGSAFSYQVTASNTPTSYGATGLPAGLSVNSTSGLISGTPTTAGTSIATLSASNSGGTGSASLTLTIASAPIPAPVITSATTASGTVGSAFSYQITASNTPTSYGATGLPAGLSVNSASGLISGTPTAAGTSTVTLSASNSGSTGSASLTLTLNPAPAAPGQLTSNPASLAFGSAQVGSSLTLTDSLTNTGGSAVTISQATATGTGFNISGLNVPLTLNPGASVTFSALFAPQSAGSASGGITVVSNASNSTLTVPLTGTGTAAGQLTLAPTALSFGNATVGSSVSQTSSLSASGASVTVSSASLSSAEFSLTGISLPVTIAAGQSVPVTMTFSPQSSGSASGVLTIAGNGSNTATQTLSGVGVAPPQHSVSLSWTDTNSGIAGYNVYRGNSAGGPFTQINSGLDATPAYSDTSVAAGQTYYYVATAVNESGAESAYSNEVEGAVPSP